MRKKNYKTMYRNISGRVSRTETFKSTNTDGKNNRVTAIKWAYGAEGIQGK